MNYIDPGQTPDDFYNFCSSIDGSVFSLYADKLHRLGVSSGSFNRSNIVESLTQGGIPLIAAGDIVSEFHEKFRKSKNMGIFWDYENIKPELGQQTGVQIMASIRQRMSIFAEVLEMHIYVPAHLVDAALQFPGAVVHYVPVNRRYEVADKMIIVDAIGYAFDTKDPIVCIISGDSDFSALISKLQMLGVRTIAVTEDNSSVRSMRSVSMLNLSWPSDFMDAAAVSPGYYTGRSASSRPVSPAVRSVSPTTTSQFDNNNNNNSNSNPKPPAFSTSHAKSPTRATLAVPPPRDSWAAVSPTTTSSTGTPPRRSQQYLGAPKSSDTANILAPFSPLFRRNSTLVQAAPTPVFSEEEMNTASKSDFLVILLTKLKEQTGSRKIPEALVAKVLRQNFGGVSLNSFTGPALLRGAIEIGNSSGGVAWIGLPKQRGSNRASNNSGDSEDSSTVASYSEESSSSSSSSSNNNTILGARANTLKYDSAPPPPTSGTAHPSPATSSSSLLSAASANTTTNNTGSSAAAATTSANQNLPHPRSEIGNNARTPATPAASTSASFGPSEKPFYVSYRLLKNHKHSEAILNLRQSDFDNFRIDIVDTRDRDEPEKYTRRAFGPFPSQVVAEEFILSLKKSYAVPKLLRFRPS